MAQKIQHYDVGDLWVPQATFTVSGVNTDPTNLTVRQQDAAGVETVLLNNVSVATLTGSSTPVAKTATGIFKLNPGITLNASGYWFVKFEGTGTAAATEQQQAIVDPDEFTSDAGVATHALVSLTETKAYLRQLNIDTSEDLDLVRVINDISDRFTYEAGGREFKVVGTNPQTRDFELQASDWMLREVQVGDMSAVTAAQLVTYSLDGSVADTTSLLNFVSLPRVRKTWEPITSIQFPYSIIEPAYLFRAVIRVTGNFGFPAVPGNVRQAVLNAVAAVTDHNVENYLQDLGAVVPSSTSGGEAGNVIMLPGRAQKLLALPPASAAVAWSYRGEAALV